MKDTFQAVKRFLTSEDGPTAVEYAVMLALIIVIAVATIGPLGNTVAGIFGSVDTTLGGGG